MKKTVLKIGYAPTRREVFSREDAKSYKEMIETKIKDWDIEIVNIDWLNEEGLLYNPLDASRVAERFKEKGVDALFAPHCNFGTEDAVARLAKEMKKPLLLWGPRDDAPLKDGIRTRDTQCGLFATGKILRRFGAPFTYVGNCSLNSPLFERGFDTFLKVSSVVKAMDRPRIGQVGTRPAEFLTVMYNESELLECFGIEVIPISLSEFVRRVKDTMKSSPKEVEEVTASIQERVSCDAVSLEKLRLLAALKIALTDWAKEMELSAIALQCWNALQEELDIFPCFINGELTNEGLPITCETDINGAVTAIMAQASRMGETPIFFADLTVRHPENENAELLWHCGNFPSSLYKDKEKASLGSHFILPSGCAGTGEGEIIGGEVTILRFDGDHGEYSLFMGHGHGAEGPMTRGTYMWLEVGDWLKWEERLVKGPYIHHVVGIHGHVAPVLYEACRYLPGIIADPIEPEASEIEAYLRGSQSL